MIANLLSYYSLATRCYINRVKPNVFNQKEALIV